jgi:hypothetical protein
MHSTVIPPQERAAWKQPLPRLRELLATPAETRAASLQVQAAGL